MHDHKKHQKDKSTGDLQGVSVRGFPLDAVDTELVVLLEGCGMPKLHKDFSINRNNFICTVDIENLANSDCVKILECMNGQTFLNKVIRVKGILDAKIKDKDVTEDNQNNDEGAEETDDDDQSGDDEENEGNNLEARLESNINSIPGLNVSPEEKKQAILKMKKAENLSKDTLKPNNGQVRVSCGVCGKVLNEKSLARHMRDLHIDRRPSVSSLVSGFDPDLKRKPEGNLSPPSTELAPKNGKESASQRRESSDGGSPNLKGNSVGDF